MLFEVVYQEEPEAAGLSRRKHNERRAVEGIVLNIAGEVGARIRRANTTRVEAGGFLASRV